MLIQHGALPELVPDFSGVLSNRVGGQGKGFARAWNHDAIYDYSRRYHIKEEIRKISSWYGEAWQPL